MVDRAVGKMPVGTTLLLFLGPVLLVGLPGLACPALGIVGWP